MKLFKHQYGGFLKEAPESSAWANISAGSDTLGMQKGDANIQIEKLPNSMGGDTIQRYRVSQLLPRGGKRTISNGTGDYKSIIDRWKQQYGGGYNSVNVGGDVDTEDMNYEDQYTAPEEYQEGGFLAKARELMPTVSPKIDIEPNAQDHPQDYDYEVYETLPEGNILPRYKTHTPFNPNAHTIMIRSPKDEFGRVRRMTRTIEPRRQGDQYNFGLHDPEDYENDTTYTGWGYGEPSKETFNKTFNKVMQSALKGRVKYRRRKNVDGY